MMADRAKQVLTLFDKNDKELSSRSEVKLYIKSKYLASNLRKESSDDDKLISIGKGVVRRSAGMGRVLIFVRTVGKYVEFHASIVDKIFEYFLKISGKEPQSSQIYENRR